MHAPALARHIAGVDQAGVPQSHYAIGHYYRLSGRAPVDHLIYPLPDANGLGIHLTIDLAGQVKFGPDVRWIDSIDYAFDNSRFSAFVAAIQSYFPELDPARLHPDYTGIRPKIVGPGAANADFRIDGEVIHGVSGLVNLYGIESPGLTAALAIGRHVAAMF
jgi:L-2-hydroxyglutarate oxidase LhgO